MTSPKDAELVTPEITPEISVALNDYYCARERLFVASVGEGPLADDADYQTAVEGARIVARRLVRLVHNRAVRQALNAIADEQTVLHGEPAAIAGRIRSLLLPATDD